MLRRPELRGKPQRRHPTPADWGLAMTVCIAGFAVNQTSIIAVSDRRLTYGDIAADVASVAKAVKIHPAWMAMYAGNDIGNVTPILDRVRLQLSDVAAKQGLVTRVDVAREFRGAFRAHHRTLIEERVLAPYDMRVRDFQDHGFKTLGPRAFDELRHAVEATKVDCEFLVCGFSEEQPQIFVVGDTGLSYYDKIGYWCIGSGSWSALSSLAFRQFHVDLPYEEALYQILEAKFMADTAVPTVGRDTYALVLTKHDTLGIIDQRGVDVVRGIWEKEGRPRTPRNLAKRIPSANYTIALTGVSAVRGVGTLGVASVDQRK